MKIEQIYTGCISHAAYYLEDHGEVAIFDPLREVQQYIDKAHKDHAKIKYVFETHFHADFVSGHIDLARKTGALIVYGPTTTQTGFKIHVSYDGEEFKLGKTRIKVIHTPGHTMESTCFLIMDEFGRDHSLITGDTLFIGDVGRPDLAQHLNANLTQEKLAGYLYDSLRNKIIPLGDNLVIYPNHGAGSACGKNMSKETSDTLGHQKKVNYALNPNLSRDQFIKEILSGLVSPPGYFPQNVLLNIKGYENFDSVMKRSHRALTPDEFEVIANETGAVIIDTRHAQDFAKAFVPNSINIGIDGNFATWVGTLIPDVKQEILIVADEGKEHEVITRLARVGFDRAMGFLKGGIASWLIEGKDTDSILSVGSHKTAEILKEDYMNILDVRKASEYNSEHIIDAINTPLDFINDSMLKIDKNKKYFVHCAGGYRSMTFISVLQARGYRNLIDVKGGFKEMKESAEFKISEYSKPATAL